MPQYQLLLPDNIYVRYPPVTTVTLAPCFSETTAYFNCVPIKVENIDSFTTKINDIVHFTFLCISQEIRNRQQSRYSLTLNCLAVVE
ncbi:hypothetical protein T12_12116 [Trichinella patagoniensis]|uniref:Uncharacterized protein n=1 Tax=Trichinella patagoniensis TaxID=990121 RepID=A0A0V0ZP98_9BILA|nr:hypothetical protein T12_12116 [Trichinella patagoniensis]